MFTVDVKQQHNNNNSLRKEFAYLDIGLCENGKKKIWRFTHTHYGTGLLVDWNRPYIVRVHATPYYPIQHPFTHAQCITRKITVYRKLNGNT